MGRTVHWRGSPSLGSTRTQLLLGCGAVGLFGAGLRLGGAGQTMGGAVAGALVGALALPVLWLLLAPSLYLLGTWLGARLRLRAVLALSLQTLSFGGLALGAALPLTLLARFSMPWALGRRIIAGLVLAAAGGAALELLAQKLRAGVPARGAADGTGADATPRRSQLLWILLLALAWVQIVWAVWP